jgi:hypothetical protein
LHRPGEPVDLQNLDRYLRYCKDVIFKGAEPAAGESHVHGVDVTHRADKLVPKVVRFAVG